jgi:peptide/nickel transport system ATP-binding protein
MAALLEVNDLRTRFATDHGVVTAVDGVSFSMQEGQILGLVGESGSGKSVTCLTIMGLNSRRHATTTGVARFRGEDLLTMPEDRLRSIRGNDIAMIFQDPMSSLNPVETVGSQIVEAIRLHGDVTRRAAKRRALELLKEVGIPHAERRIDDYPHRFSGGMRQRAMIAMALANDPALLIADEPTTALDVTTQAQILALLARLRRDYGSAIILITHDLGVVAEVADEVAVLYAARLAERASTHELFRRPLHPYTWGLMDSLPHVDGERERLNPIPGQPPSLVHPPGGCRFHPRCVHALDVCRDVQPPLVPEPDAPGHLRACVLDAVTAETAARGRLDGAAAVRAARADVDRDELLAVEDLRKEFPVRRGSLLDRDPGVVRAVDGVSFTLRRGETLGIVGESGCGKSTLARCIARLIDPTAGRIVFDGRDLTAMSRHDLRPLRRELTMVFQDPFGSLNPRKRVGFIVTEPMDVHAIGTQQERKRRAQELLDIVGLNPEHYDRFPHEFSGGQRQRIGIARALAANPKLVICDEPVSALDVSIQAQLLTLLKDLQRDFDLTFIFVAHDLNVVRHVADRVMVMYLGRVVELAPAAELYASPQHPYTAALLGSVPIADPELGRARERTVLTGEVPNPIDPPSGCHFHPRCPRAVAGTCDSSVPELQEIGAHRLVRCLYPLGGAPAGAWEGQPSSTLGG